MLLSLACPVPHTRLARREPAAYGVRTPALPSKAALHRSPMRPISVLRHLCCSRRRRRAADVARDSLHSMLPHLSPSRWSSRWCTKHDAILWTRYERR